MTTKWWVQLSDYGVVASGQVYCLDRNLADDRAARIAGFFCEMCGVPLTDARLRRSNGTTVYGVEVRKKHNGVMNGNFKRSERPVGDNRNG